MQQINWERRRTLFSNLFKKSDKPSAAVFVDYEHWYYGYNNIFSMKPNVQEWYDELTEEYNVKKLMFFGDFNGSAIEKELPKLEKILTKGSNTIELHRMYLLYLQVMHILIWQLSIFVN